MKTTKGFMTTLIIVFSHRNRDPWPVTLAGPHDADPRSCATFFFSWIIGLWGETIGSIGSIGPSHFARLKHLFRKKIDKSLWNSYIIYVSTKTDKLLGSKVGFYGSNLSVGFPPCDFSACVWLSAYRVELGGSSPREQMDDMSWVYPILVYTHIYTYIHLAFQEWIVGYIQAISPENIPYICT